MRSRACQRGIALISALLLLLVMTIMGVAMFHSFGLLEMIAGNTMDKQRALHAAGSAQTFAEWWLTSVGGVNATSGSTCSGVVTAPASAQVCSNAITAATSLPWSIGETYSSWGLDGAPANYFQSPQFYISYLTGSYNTTTGTQTNSYQIDAVGYGGNQNSAAVTESTYNVSVTYTTQTSLSKFINLGGN
ncbi:MAG: pilus assembly PilX family protein [Steroidobacteraceae bacterium]